MRNRYFHYLHILHGNNTYMQKREQKDIWRNLYELPLIETEHPIDITELIETEEFKNLFRNNSEILIKHTKSIKHRLTHQIIHTQFYRITIPDNMSFPSSHKFITVTHNGIHSFPMSRLTQKYLETIEKINC